MPGHDRDGYGPGENPRYNLEARATAADTARFLSGETKRLKMTVDNPEIQAALERQSTALQQVLYGTVVPGLAGALARDSESTARRLCELAAAAQDGDVRSGQLMATMIGELLTQGLNA